MVRWLAILLLTASFASPGWEEVEALEQGTSVITVTETARIGGTFVGASGEQLTLRIESRDVTLARMEIDKVFAYPSRDETLLVLMCWMAGLGGLPALILFFQARYRGESLHERVIISGAVLLGGCFFAFFVVLMMMNHTAPLYFRE